MPCTRLPAQCPGGQEVLQRLPGDAGSGPQRAHGGKASEAQAGRPPGGLKPVHIGCSGWNYRDWRGRFYSSDVPASRWLEHYSRVFETVEVNSTFYRLASETAVERWVEQTPPGFIFSLKASRYLTHVRRLRELAEGVRRFYAPLTPLIEAGRLGPILWQLPENFRRDDEVLRQALEALPEGRHCFEFRHPSWFEEDVFELLREHHVALVIGDHPERPFQPLEITAGWTFIRFHYGRRGRNGNYSAAELRTWKRRIAAWRSRVEVFAYFNNDWQGIAPSNARSLARGLST
jgi:uncharacterized protein YecE (DUF72 family)